jgi:hypothetical protein
MDVVGGGLNQGFSEAQTILSNLKVFSGTVKDNYANTLDLVQKGMEAFKNQQLDINPTADAPVNPASSEAPIESPKIL